MSAPAPFRTVEDAERYYRLEGFRVGYAYCRRCGCQWNAVIHPNVVAWRLNCPRCGYNRNWFNDK